MTGQVQYRDLYQPSVQAYSMALLLEVPDSPENQVQEWVIGNLVLAGSGHVPILPLSPQQPGLGQAVL